jgi:hypothetical protein
MGLRLGGQARLAQRAARAASGFNHGRLARTSSTLIGAGRFGFTGWFTGSLTAAPLVACDAPHPMAALPRSTQPPPRKLRESGGGGVLEEPGSRRGLSKCVRTRVAACEP